MQHNAEVVFEVFTPHEAQEALNTSKEDGGNHRWTSGKLFSKRHRDRLVRDMVEGRFYPCSTIMFTTYGRLVDGHHRLAAVVECDIPQQFVVIRNAPPEWVGPKDTDLMARTLNQSANAVGMEWMSSKEVSKLVNAMRQAMRTQSSYTSSQEDFEFAERYRTAMEFTASQFTTRKTGISIAPVQGAVARAYYHVDPRVLQRFVRVLYTGWGEVDTDQSIIVLRDWLLRESNRSSGGAGKAEVYAKVARAICAVRDGEVLQKLYAAPEDPFPLPEEEHFNTSFQ